MHIIVDIRSTSPHEIIPIRTGIAWAKLWKKYKKEDTISFLLSENQQIVDNFHCITVPRHFGPFGKKPLRPKTGKEIFRCVSFSELEPYDSTIPTLLHIWSNAHTFYPDPSESSLHRRVAEYMKKRCLISATTIVVPDIQVGRELVELYDIGEGQIEIIPYTIVPRISSRIPPMQKIQTVSPYFLYDGGYGDESNLLYLLTAWERYCHDGGKYELFLLGSARNFLSELTHILRSLDLRESVKYLGGIDDTSLDRLYRDASGWIYTGPYYSAGSTIELARAYELPLLLSDIPALREYSGIYVHPNHISEIVEGLSRLERATYIPSVGYQEESYIEAYEKILIKKI